MRLQDRLGQGVKDARQGWALAERTPRYAFRTPDLKFPVNV